GPPRIAPFFTDLDPSGTYNGGLTGFVIAESSARSSTFHWVSVAKLFDPETNSFSVTLNSDGKIEMDWGAMMGTEVVLRGSIVGLTQGNGTPDPGSQDLSRRNRLPLRGTIYESFIAPFSFYERRPFNVPSFDLSFGQLRFGRDNNHNDAANDGAETPRSGSALRQQNGPHQE
ncbi:MAG: hypothetical protein ND866_26150, partial [Pyrinomonadaceae bacterium]|nr:hypothetical protein [Pyrinomonadaceae bacterium]